MKLAQIIRASGYYKARVIPKQARAGLRAVMADGTLKIALTSAPEKGRANQELVRFICDELAIGKDRVRITKGLTSRVKLIHVELS
jgi:uncharacterized protein YggU (UPF0235/DUF167 family)